MVSILRGSAALFIVASGVMVVAFDSAGKLFAILLIVGNLLGLAATWLERRPDRDA